MAKWADYCISAVRYNAEHTHIVKVKVHIDSGDTIGTATEWTRSEVVTAIECIKRSMSHSLIGQGAHRDRSMPHTLIGGCRTQ